MEKLAHLIDTFMGSLANLIEIRVISQFLFDAIFDQVYFINKCLYANKLCYQQDCINNHTSDLTR